METLTHQKEELQSTTPTSLISQAIEKGLGVEELSKLMDLQERWEANQSKKLFFSAFNEFQSICPDIKKNKKVSFTTRTGGSTEYHYAPLADIVIQIRKQLKECGLSFRWEVQDTPEVINVTCLISHIDGHTEKTTMQAKADDSGGKNSIQARGSAIEYMKRYTLCGALGIATADSDIDGRLPAPEVDINKLHSDFMEVYGQVIQLDPTLSKWHPDNWTVERTPKVYVKSTGQLRKILFELQNKEK